MANLVGIDLGTTFSAISMLDDLGRPEIIPIDSERITPSVVFIDEYEPNRHIAGTTAKQLLTDQKVADRVIQEVKREMGTNKLYKIDDFEYSPVQISSFILRKLVKEASNYRGNISEAVITVPANFSEKERKATMDAGTLAGIKVNHIVNEPTAAAIYYSSLNPISGNVLIYDLGGGTFDVTVARITKNNVDVISSAGDKHLGGTDFDQRLLEMVNKRYKDDFGQSMVTDDNRQELLFDAERYKKNLSDRDLVRASFKWDTGIYRTVITKNDFEESISQYITKTELLIDSVLDEANLTSLDINEILLVGGSTRIPLVTKTITRRFNKEPLKAVNPDEAVALGAAIYAGLKADKDKLTAAQANMINNMKLSEVCNDYYGTLGLDFDDASEQLERKNFIILNKNTPLPCFNTHEFQTIRDGQTAINCAVTQSKTDETDPQFVQVIWEGRLEGLPSDRPAGQPVEVTFSYDSNQRMHCKYKDINSGKELEVDLHPGHEEVLETQKIHLEQILIE